MSYNFHFLSLELGQANDCSSISSEISTVYGIQKPPKSCTDQASSCCVYAELAPMDPSTSVTMLNPDLSNPSNTTVGVCSRIKDQFTFIHQPDQNQSSTAICCSRLIRVNQEISRDRHLKKARYKAITNPLFETELIVMKAAGIHPYVVALVGRCMFPGKKTWP